MMMDPTLVVTAASLFAICIVALAGLRAWQDWLELKRQELERLQHSAGSRMHRSEIGGGAAVGAARIELADMKERIRKLEAIASGVEL